MKKFLHKISSPGEPLLKTIFKLGYFLFTRPGIEFIMRKSKRFLENNGLIKNHDLSYHDWILAQSDPEQAKKVYQLLIEKTVRTPLITLIITVEGLSARDLTNCLASIKAQAYPNWELTIVCKEEDENKAQLIANNTFHGVNKVSITSFPDSMNQLTALNEAAKTASGSYIIIIEQQNTLTPNCLLELAKHIERHPDNELIYTDNDRGSVGALLHNPYFKPDWSPDLFLAKNYIGPAFALSTNLWKKLGGVNEQHDEEYLYDLVLRATETTNNIGHISMVLFHVNTVLTALDEGQQVIEAALHRRNQAATVTKTKGVDNLFFINYAIINNAKVSIVIPTKDNVQMLKTTIDSIFKLTTYTNYEIILLNNNSISTDFFELVAEYEIKYATQFRCVAANFPFNFSRLINLGVAESKGSNILMLNNDMEVLHADWLDKMIGYAQQPHIGAVGVKLLYTDNNIQHAGVVLGVGEGASHAFINLPKDTDTHFHQVQSTCNYSAVTAACLMVRKESFLEVGGMDEELPVEFNDIDFCLKLRKHGFYNVYIPAVELYHYESATRGHPFKSIESWKQHEHDLKIFNNKWGNIITDDPFYNKNLSVDYTDFRQQERKKR